LPTLTTLAGVNFENTAFWGSVGYMSQNLKTVRYGKNWVNSANLLFSLESLNSKPNFTLLALGEGYVRQTGFS
jgi:hypothetical protein